MTATALSRSGIGQSQSVGTGIVAAPRRPLRPALGFLATGAVAAALWLGGVSVEPAPPDLGTVPAAPQAILARLAEWQAECARGFEGLTLYQALTGAPTGGAVR